jgi:hypothetical protein
MLFLRTAIGGFVKAESIVGLSPQRGEGREIADWLAICADGSEIALAAFYAVPGRIERALPHLFPSQGTAPARRRVLVPYTNLVLRRGADRTVPSSDRAI